MREKWSLNKLMHNEKLMIAFSLVIAIVVWASVVYGPSNIETRTITIPVVIDLSGTYAESNGIRVIGDNTVTVQVEVKGARAVIGSLSHTDILVKPSVNMIQGAGTVELTLTPAQNSRVTDYSFVSIKPSTVTVHCDYWVSANFPLSADVSSVQLVEQEPPLIKGSEFIDTDALDNGMVTLEGPKAVVSQVTSMVALAESSKPIADDQVYSAKIHALDEHGARVDISACNIVNLPSGTVNVTVPVWIQREVPFTYTLKNVPPALLNRPNLITLSSDTVTLIGSRTAVDELSGMITNLGVIDFDRISPENPTLTIPLTIPEGIKTLENIEEVVVTVRLDGYTSTSKYLSLLGKDIRVLNAPADKTVTITTASIQSIRLCGTAASLGQITADDLTVIVDLSNYTSTGSTGARFAARILVDEILYDDVWVYYGETGYELIGTVK